MFAFSNRNFSKFASIYNMSFAKGIVPHQLKISKVIFVYKKGNRNFVGNYRPISLLNVFEKNSSETNV